MRGLFGAMLVLLPSVLVGPELDTDPRVPCEDECRRVLRVCINDGVAPPPIEPKPKDVAQCASLCRAATPRRFYSCVFRQFYCEGFEPCIGDK